MKIHISFSGFYNKDKPFTQPPRHSNDFLICTRMLHVPIEIGTTFECVINGLKAAVQSLHDEQLIKRDDLVGSYRQEFLTETLSALDARLKALANEDALNVALRDHYGDTIFENSDPIAVFFIHWEVPGFDKLILHDDSNSRITIL